MLFRVHDIPAAPIRAMNEQMPFRRIQSGLIPPPYTDSILTESTLSCAAFLVHCLGARTLAMLEALAARPDSAGLAVYGSPSPGSLFLRIKIAASKPEDEADVLARQQNGECMKHTRRDFITVSSTALAVPAKMHGASVYKDSPRPIPDMSPSEGNVSVIPSGGTAGKYGTWTVTYRVGKSGIRKNGGIRVQLPDSWHSGIRNAANRLQATDPKADHYISSVCSREDTRLRTWVEHEPKPNEVLVKDSRPGLDGRLGRYVFVVRIWLLDGDLKEGDTLSVIYGDTSGASLGMLAAIISTSPEPSLMAVDIHGTGDFRMHPDRPTLQAHAGPAAELMVSGPSTLIQGKAAELLLSVVDEHHNPANSFDGDVTLRLIQGQADIPLTVKFASKRGWEKVRIVPKAPGIVRLAATGQDGKLQSKCNPMRVFEREPKLKIYWGDLHSHTHYSLDGVGHNNFEYARYTSGLDFYAMTDHSAPAIGTYSHGLGPSVPHVWAEYTSLTEKHHDSGKFVTLHAYECSFGSPYGHHNIYFRGKPGPLMSGDVSLSELWKALTVGQALTIPHHTGKMPFPVFWTPNNSELRRNIEIYSAHGLSEAYNPSHPLSFENSTFTDPSRSAHGHQHAQDAWVEGLRLSTIASSDDHRAHPGQPQYGLAAVAATDLTRDGIFDSLYRRCTYGTTGAKILLDFTIDGQPMGQEVTVSGTPSLTIEAHGTDDIEVVEVLRHSQSDGAFKVILVVNPGTPDFQWTQRDQAFQEDSIYYVRLRQVGLIRNQIAMAWSSPIWVRRR
jgi:hypothetical protein